jgi:enoyl-CoA hydratase/carnithine racemase
VAARLLATTQDAILRLTLSNPAARNALHPDIYRDGIAAIAAAATDPDVRAIVVCGEGSHFCAGGNLNRLEANRAQPPAVQAASIDLLHAWIRAIRDCPKPVIAAIEGVAAGAGFSLALACDLVVAATDARFLMAYVKVGLTPDGGGSHWLIERLPYPLAYEILATGRPVDAQRLHALGLVNQLAEPGTALSCALTRAGELAGGPAHALGRIKSLLQSGERERLARQLDRERDEFVDALHHDDAGEGIRAFLEKRPPRYRANPPPDLPAPAIRRPGAESSNKDRGTDS